MAMIIARLKVKDFRAWKSIYDEYNDTHKDIGVRMAAIRRDPDDANMVILMHQFDDIDEVYEFSESEEMRRLMEKSGIIGEPEIWFGEDVEFTIY
jgi:quinol monooxygenase YgiN